jgi:glutamine synthetase
MAGLLKHVPEFCLVTNQWVNSYKRLVPGFEAPVYISWARKNRSDLIRIPAYKPGKERTTRIELRSPDPSCNPYLAFSVMLAAGLDGLDKGYSLEPPVEENVFTMSESERQRRGIKTLPTDLHEAIELCEKSELVHRALGDHIFHSLIENKKIEWSRYRAHVTDYEIREYLPLL